MTLLEFNGVGFGYPGQAPILSNINLALNSGERLLILGANGSGKSTIGYIAAGIISPVTGKVSWIDNHGSSGPFPTAKVGLVFQNSRNQMIGITVEEDLAFGLYSLGWPQKVIQEKVELFLNNFGLFGKRNYTINQLSGGELKCLALAGALITQPQLLILDEPLAMLDSKMKQNFIKLLWESVSQETAILWLDHDLRNLRYISNWMILNQNSELETVTEQELLSPDFLNKHHLEPAPLNFLEWKYPALIKKTMFGPDMIKVK